MTQTQNQTEMSIAHQYWIAVCEADAGWKLYCSHPTETTWSLYVEAKAKEKRLELLVSQEEKRNEKHN